MEMPKPKIRLSTKITIYDKLDFFKEKFESDFYNHSSEIDFYTYLQLLKSLYTKFIDSQKPITLQLGLKVDVKEKISGQTFKIENDKLNITVVPDDNIYKIISQQSQILKFIEIEIAKENEKLKVRKIGFTPLETFEIPENDYSGKNELKPKEKLIVLDKLGVVEFLTDKLNVSDNATHLADILGVITGIDNQKGTLTGYCNYLIRPDHGNKNSPYFSETTVRKANRIYNTFNIKDKTD